jgi:hypothetical protein
MSRQPTPVRSASVQYAEFLLLKQLQEFGIKFVIVGGTAAYAYGLEVSPKDLDIIVQYDRERWQRILLLADEIDPKPGGAGLISREPVSFPTQLHVNIGRGLDVLSGFRQATFSELYPRRKEAIIKVDVLEDEQPFPVADLKDLIASWRERSEPRDARLIRVAESLARGRVR